MAGEFEVVPGVRCFFKKDSHLIYFESEKNAQCLLILDFLKKLGVRVTDLKDYGKSMKVDPSTRLVDIIGEDTSDANPYSAFWKLMKVWPRSQNQRAKEAAIAFREAVDTGVDGRTILEAATALLEATQYVSRLDIWIKNEGYLNAPAPSVSTRQEAAVQTPQADEVWF